MSEGVPTHRGWYALSAPSRHPLPVSRAYLRLARYRVVVGAGAGDSDNPA
jgi:hypothetical protein